MQADWRKQRSRTYALIAALIMLIYAGIAYWLEQKTVEKHETEFNNSQAAQAESGARDIKGQFHWMVIASDVVATYAIPQYLEQNIPLSMLEKVFRGMILETYPDQLAMGFFTTPTSPELCYAIASSNGTLADEQLHAWITDYWDEVRTQSDIFVTPFHVTPTRQIYGLLRPITWQGEFVGVLGTVLDFAPVLDQHIVPLRSGQFGAAWVQDANGIVIYDHETQIIGQDVTELNRAYADVQRVYRRMFAEDTGQDEYRFTVQRGGEVKRKLVAWNTVYLGNQRLTIAVSAPDNEINQELTDFRRQILWLGLLLGVTLISSGGIFYLHRQSYLESLVRARTTELQTLNNELEQRVVERTSELEHERAQLKTILEAMHDGVVFRMNDEVKYANQALAHMTGFDYDEFMAHPMEIHRHVAEDLADSQAQRMRTEIRQAIQRKTVWHGEIKMRRKDGSQFDAAFSVAPIINDGADTPVGIVEVFRDISQEKALQAERARFIAHAAHQLRTPLTNLKTRLYLLRHQPLKQAEHLETAEKAADDLAVLVRDLMRVFSFEQNAIEPEAQRIDLQDIVRAALTGQQPDAQRRNVTLHADLAGEALSMQGDSTWLTEAITNLITCMIDHTESGGRVDVRLAASHEGGLPQIRIEIENSGDALDPTLQTYFFEPFSHASLGDVQHTGLELSLAKMIIDQHNGQVFAQNGARGGSMIVVLLPRDVLFES